MLSTAPIALTSLKSRAHAALVRARGPGVRNCDEVLRRNGFTRPTQGVGSSSGCPVTGSLSGHQCPGALFGTHCEGPKRPSPWRAAIITAAAAFPAAMPFVFDRPSGIPARKSWYCVASDASKVARAASMMLGTVATMSASTACAAVATAASFEARAENRFFSRYGW